MSPPPTILIAGIGNIFLGDDAFGSEVARRLELRTWPEGVRVVDFGIRGLDLAYALLDGHDLTILIDATPRGGQPGTLYVIEPDLSVVETAGQNGTLFDAHTLDPLKVLGMARMMGASWRRMLLVGCEPGDLGGEEGRLGLSDAVRVAVDEGVKTVARLVDDFLHGTLHGRSHDDGGQAVLSNAAASSESGETHSHENVLAKEPQDVSKLTQP
jgi:hydrogenase maturation protease